MYFEYKGAINKKYITMPYGLIYISFFSYVLDMCYTVNETYGLTFSEKFSYAAENVFSSNSIRFFMTMFMDVFFSSILFQVIGE